jgi:hypothetical protein
MYTGTPKSINQDRITAIHAPIKGEVRVRKIVKRSNSFPTGKYPSWKMGRMMHWRSLNILAAFCLLDAMPSVASFREEALKIDYQYQGKHGVFYPDLLVQIDGRRELWTIKPKKLAGLPDEIALAQFLRTELSRHGLYYRVVIAELLNEEPLQSNLIRLIQFGKHPVPLIDQEQARQLLSQSNAIDWEAISSGLLGPNGRQVICRLALDGLVRFNIKELWSEKTTFQLIAAPSKSGGH